MIRVRELAKEVNEITEDDFILISNPHWDAKMKASNLVNPNAQYLDSEGKLESDGLSYQLKNLNTLDGDPDYIGQTGIYNEEFYIAVQASGTKWQKLNNIAIDITDIAALSAVPLDGAEIPVIGEFAGTTAIYISSTQIGGGSYLKALFDISGKGLNGKKIQIGGIIHSGYAINEQDYTSESDYQLSVSCNLISGEDIEYNAQSSSVIEFKSYHKRIRFYAEVTPAVGVDTIELLFTIHNTTGNNANARLFQLARVFYSLAEEPVSYERDLDTLKELVKINTETKAEIMEVNVLYPQPVGDIVQLYGLSTISFNIVDKNTIYVTRVRIPNPILVNSVSTQIQMFTSGGVNIDYGLFDLNGMEIINGVSFNIISNGIKTATLPSPIYVNPGDYLMASRCRFYGAISGAYYNMALSNSIGINTSDPVINGIITAPEGNMPSSLDLSGLVANTRGCIPVRFN